jgi:hypothetical protein
VVESALRGTAQPILVLVNRRSPFRCCGSCALHDAVRSRSNVGVCASRDGSRRRDAVGVSVAHRAHCEASARGAVVPRGALGALPVRSRLLARVLSAARLRELARQGTGLAHRCARRGRVVCTTRCGSGSPCAARMAARATSCAVRHSRVSAVIGCTVSSLMVPAPSTNNACASRSARSGGAW